MGNRGDHCGPVAIIGVVISLYYYFGVIRTVYWSDEAPNLSPIVVSLPMKVSICVGVAAMLYLGIFPDLVVTSATEAVKALKF